jgi:hypothetical protein
MGAQASSAAGVQHGDTVWATVNALTALSPAFSTVNAAGLEDDSHAAALVVARHALHAEVAALAKKHPAVQASLAKVQPVHFISDMLYTPASSKLLRESSLILFTSSCFIGIIIFRSCVIFSRERFSFCP